MRADDRIFLDACVLAKVRRTHLEKLHWPPALAATFQTEIGTAFPDAPVSGYENLLPVLTNHENDRHVLAAAIRGNCPLIVTFNLQHFPAAALRPWSITASHPQDYLLILYEMESRQVTACLGEIAGKRKLEIQDVLIRLGQSVPKFSQRLLDDLS